MDFRLPFFCSGQNFWLEFSRSHTITFTNSTQLCRQTDDNPDRVRAVFQLCSSCASNSDRRLKKCFAAILETILLFPANLLAKLRAKEMYACHLLSFIVFTSITPHAASSPHTLTAALPSRTVIDLISDGFSS